MSTTATKRALASAELDARRFVSLFPPGSFARWEFGGSVRRGCVEIGDVEHVIDPVFADVPDPKSLFGAPVLKNLVFDTLDKLVADKIVTKHIYGTTGPRWGDKYRGVDFRGFNHELFMADLDNWAPTLTIRTGPADFSRRVVTGLLQNGYRNHLGYVWECRRCPNGDHREKECPLCQGTGLEPVKRMSVADEREYLALAGMRWIEPERRV